MNYINFQKKKVFDFIIIQWFRNDDKIVSQFCTILIVWKKKFLKMLSGRIQSCKLVRKRKEENKRKRKRKKGNEENSRMKYEVFAKRWLLIV